MHSLLTRLTALEHDRRAEAERLADWIEAIIVARTPELDEEVGEVVIAELCERDPTLEGRAMAAYAVLGFVAHREVDGTIVVSNPKQRL